MNENKKKKREKMVKEKLLKRRLLERRLNKERIKFMKLEAKERKLDPKERKAQALIDYKIAQKKLYPGENKPCVCGSGKKFKKCCMNDLTSGKLEITFGQDYKLIVQEPAIKIHKEITEETVEKEATTEE